MKEFIDQDLDFFVRGEFREANELPLEAVKIITEEIVDIQEQLGLQMNSLMTMYRDGRTGKALGFNLVNYKPNGIDCKHEDKELFLEVKSVDWNEDYGLRSIISITNTNMDKAAAFCDRKLFLGVSVWSDANDLMFIIVGQNRELGEEVKKKLQEQLKTGKSACVRPTLYRLIHTYGFKVIAVNRTKEAVANLIDPYHKETKEWLDEVIIDITDFHIDDLMVKTSKLLNQDLEWFHTGDFINTTKDDFKKICDVMDCMGIVQNLYGLKHTDTLFNIYHDSITGQLLGFDTMNIGGGGADCKMKDNSMFLEVKSTQWSDSGLIASVNFTDTTLDKAEAFRDDRLYIGVSVWKNVNELMFLVVGQNSAIGENMAASLKEGESKSFRIALSTLIKKYGFKIVPITITKEELIGMIQEINLKTFNDISLEDCFVKLEDLDLEKCRSRKSNNVNIDDFARTDMKKLSKQEITKLRRNHTDDEVDMYILLHELSRLNGGFINIGTKEIAKIIGYGKSKVHIVINKMISNGLLNRGYIYGSRAPVYSVIDIKSVMLAA